MGTDSPHHFPSKKLGKAKPSDLTKNLESAKSFDEKVQLSKNSLGLGKRIFGKETLPHKLPHFPPLGSWYNKYRSGQEHRKMSLSCHPPPPQYEDYSFQSSVFWKSPLLLASSPLPLLSLLPRQRSRIPGGGREGCWEVGTATVPDKKGHGGLISSQGAEALVGVPAHGAEVRPIQGPHGLVQSRGEGG